MPVRGKPHNNEKAALYPDAAQAGSPAEAFAKAGTAEMSEKFKVVEREVHLDGDKVKESS